MKFPFSRQKPAIEVKKSKALALHLIQAQGAVWPTLKTTNLARESYELNVIAYSAINRIASAISNISWEVWQGDKKLKTHPLLSLISKPNPNQTGTEWWKARVAFGLIYGNIYDERVFGASVPQELWTLRPDRMKIIPGTSGFPAAYEYSFNQRRIRFQVDETTGESDIRHTKFFSPSDDWYGLSPVIPGAYSIDQHNEAMTWTQALLQNSARPSGALVYGKDESLSDEEFNRLKAEIESNYSGARNAGRPMLLEGGLDWKQMGLSPEDMQTQRTTDAAARNIALAFGVPPLLLNIPGDNTFANYREARLGFYEDTVLPLVEFMLSGLNSWLGPYFDNAELRPDYASIEAIAEKQYKMWEMADNSIEITVNESRKMKGLDPLPEPLGSMLMADLKKNGTQPPQTPINDALKEFGYGVTG